jgi:hypothetical protein
MQDLVIEQAEWHAGWRSHAVPAILAAPISYA